MRYLVQGAVTIPDTPSAPTVAKAMDKRREIPASKTKNAAPRADHERVLALLDRLGFGTEKAFTEELGRSRATFYRLKKGNATISMVREVEERLVREAQKREIPVAPTQNEQDELLTQWRELGDQLLSADPAQFYSTLDGLRDMVEATRLQRQAIHKMFRATPDPSLK